MKVLNKLFIFKHKKFIMDKLIKIMTMGFIPNMKAYRDFQKKIIWFAIGICFPPYGIYMLYKWAKAHPDYSIWFGKSDEEMKQINEDKRKTIEHYKKQVKFVDLSQIDKAISKNEKSIMDYDKNKLHDLVRLSKFIRDVESKIKENFEWGINPENIHGREVLSHLNLVKNTENLDLLVKLSITMINKLVKNKITDFLIIYEKFEEIGVFRSSFEKEMISKVDILTNKLDTISNQLRKIDGRLGYQNLVLTYNTYQTYKIRKSLKK